MTININNWDTHTYLQGIIDKRPMRGATLYDALFMNAPTVYTEAKQLIWDEIPFEHGIPTPAPFTRPCSAPEFRRMEQYRANSITFPYIDIAQEACCDILQRRIPGSSFDQSSNIGAANIQRWLEDATMRVHDDWKTRLSVMASQLVQTGSFVVEGPSIQSQIVDFGRDPALTIQLSGAQAWNQATATPLADLEGWVDLLLQKSGHYASDWFVGAEAWAYIRSNKDFQALYKDSVGDQQMGNTLLNPIGRKVTDIQLQGTYRNHRIFLVTGEYMDLDGSLKQFMPKNSVAMFGNFSPIRAFGMIKDQRANYQALDYFMSEKHDCKVPTIELQSAPLLVVGNANAMLFAKVTA